MMRGRKRRQGTLTASNAEKESNIEEGFSSDNNLGTNDLSALVEGLSGK